MVYGIWILDKLIDKRQKAKGQRLKVKDKDHRYAKNLCDPCVHSGKNKDSLSLFISLTIVLGDILKHSCAEIRELVYLNTA